MSSAFNASRANNDGSNGGGELDMGNLGGEYILVPDNTDPDNPDLAAVERDAWEVGELPRLLQNVDVARERERERLELEQRRRLTDDERREEERSSERYTAPGGGAPTCGRIERTDGWQLDTCKSGWGNSSRYPTTPILMIPTFSQPCGTPGKYGEQENER